MSYLRVIPRDLFNEANLLKCYGQIYLNLERLGYQDCLIGGDNDEPFTVCSNDDGETWLDNVQLWVRGGALTLKRPLNSRRSYPLYAFPDDDTQIEVFEDSGAFTGEMIEFLCRPS